MIRHSPCPPRPKCGEWGSSRAGLSLKAGTSVALGTCSKGLLSASMTSGQWTRGGGFPGHSKRDRAGGRVPCAGGYPEEGVKTASAGGVVEVYERVFVTLPICGFLSVRSRHNPSLQIRVYVDISPT